MAMLAAAVMREKSPEAFRTISEVAMELDMPQHVLRFWESRFAQVRPIKRAGGRRYYRPEDVDLLRGIRTLLYREGSRSRARRKSCARRVSATSPISAALRSPTGSRRPISWTFGDEPEDAPLDVEQDIEETVVIDDEPRYARAALAVVERAHGEIASSLANEERVKLEILLAELLQMKARLREAESGLGKR